MLKKEFDILVLLEKNSKPLTQREIASALGLSTGTINKIVKNLFIMLCMVIFS